MNERTVEENSSYVELNSQERKEDMGLSKKKSRSELKGKKISRQIVATQGSLMGKRPMT